MLCFLREVGEIDSDSLPQLLIWCEVLRIQCKLLISSQFVIN